MDVLGVQEVVMYVCFVDKSPLISRFHVRFASFFSVCSARMQPCQSIGLPYVSFFLLRVADAGGCTS